MTIKSPGLTANDVSPTLIRRFERKCSRPNDNECIEWLGWKTRGGYGGFRVNHTKRTTAHRIAWLIKYGDISPDSLILHRCDNPSCVNVEHLFIGSPLDNTSDMIRKGRHGWKNGPPWQKLNSVDAERINDLRKYGFTQARIAEWLNVSVPLICMVLSGRITYR